MNADISSQLCGLGLGLGLGLCCLVTPSLSKDIRCHVYHTFLKLQITRSDIRPHMKWAVSLVIACDRFNLPQGFVWVCMGKHTHFTTPEGPQVCGVF